MVVFTLGLRSLGITDIDIPTLMPWKVGHPRWLRGKEPACQCRRCWFDSLGWENPLEKGMATHSCILAWRIPCTEKPGGLHSAQGCKESDMTERLTLQRDSDYFH